MGSLSLYYLCNSSVNPKLLNKNNFKVYVLLTWREVATAESLAAFIRLVISCLICLCLAKSLLVPRIGSRASSGSRHPQPPEAAVV